MSHHLVSDLAYLQQLAQTQLRYIGLLGPAARRARLLAELKEDAQRLAGRLHGPAGLDIGANSPESIALAIVAEIQAVLAGRSGGPL
jgi:xanthine/CO dehydrogenase XdhC/CoxF family maturation factor